jgi:uncharacterized protein YuzE
MKITLDRAHGVGYVYIQNEAQLSGPAQSIEVSPDAGVDLATDGTLFGIELLNANDQLGENSIIEVPNEVTGQSQQRKLSP